VVLCDASSGAVTISLPAIATANRGLLVRVKKIDASANACTISRSGGDTIDGATTAVLASRYATKILVAPDSGTDWALLGGM